MSFFTKDSLKFLEDISKNNTKEYFEANRIRYKDHILSPSRSFVVEMGEHLLALNPHIKAIPKINQSLFKIYKDTRRNKNTQKPIKERIGIIFWQGVRKRLQCSSFYLHFNKDELFVSAGIRWFERDTLLAYRDYLKNETKRIELQNIITDIKHKGYQTAETKYKRLPKDIETDTSFKELFLYDSMFGYKTFSSTYITKGDKFIDMLFGIYSDLLELQQFVYRATTPLDNNSYTLY